MFASPFAASPALGAARSQMYRDIGVTTGVSEGNPHQLVAMLYDGLLEAISQARGALATRNIELKGKALGRAVRIVEEGLKAGVNLRDGGELAARLHELYGYLAVRLSEANLRNDDAALQECVRLIEPLREAWSGIAAQVASTPRR